MAFTQPSHKQYPDQRWCLKKRCVVPEAAPPPDMRFRHHLRCPPTASATARPRLFCASLKRKLGKGTTADAQRDARVGPRPHTPPERAGMLRPGTLADAWGPPETPRRRRVRYQDEDGSSPGGSARQTLSQPHRGAARPTIGGPQSTQLGPWGRSRAAIKAAHPVVVEVDRMAGSGRNRRFTMRWMRDH